MRALRWLTAAALAAGCAAGCNREVSAPANGAPANAAPANGAPSNGSPAEVTRPAPPPAPTAAASAEPAPASPAPSATAAAAAEPERPYVLVELAPTMGDLAPLLREHAARARDRKLRPFVEFYADWCRPCRDLNASMDDPRVVEALARTYIIRLNADDWLDKLPGTGFVPRKIPVFYALDAQGRPTGAKLVADTGVKNTPENVAPRLKAFFQG